MKELTFSIADVLDLNSLPYDRRSGNVAMDCPFCKATKHQKKFFVNFDRDVFKCHKCQVKGNSISLHALLHNVSNKEAYKQIMEYMGNPSFVKRAYVAPEETEQNVVMAPEADADQKDAAYSKLLDVCRLSDKHHQELLDRGFSESDIQTLGYGSYPRREEDKITEEYFRIPRVIMADNCNVKGVPGFYKTQKGTWTMMNSMGGTMIPYRSFENKIQGVQIRKNNEDIEDDGYKYIWFSSSYKNQGARQTTVLHYACDFSWNKEKNSFQPVLNKHFLVLTEGALKGDLAHALSDVPFVCVPGVSSALKALEADIPKWKEAEVEHIFVCYDMDQIMNVHVTEALQNMISLIESHGINTSVVTWNDVYRQFDEKIKRFCIDTDFVYTADTLEKSISKATLESDLAVLKKCGKKNIFYAATNDIPDKNIAVLRKACSDNGLAYSRIFWKLGAKGIDDFYVQKMLKKKEKS